MSLREEFAAQGEQFLLEIQQYYSRFIESDPRAEGLDPKFLEELFLQKYPSYNLTDTKLAEAVLSKASFAAELTKPLNGPQSAMPPVGSMSAQQKILSKNHANSVSMDAQQKLWFGLSALSAAMSTYTMLSSFRQAVKKDDEGKTKVEWSQVGLGLISGLFAAGSVAIALAQTNGASIQSSAQSARG
jgi:hypothetical protein